ncbi:MAG: DUF433 domain-containing protein [Bacteroidia bacterium]|nr:DUF433 domain-containing protein [Bacteroidia bacterium]
MPGLPITIDPEIVSGTPVFTGTRVPVRTLFDWLETETLDAFLENFPSVSRSQALEVLQAAATWVEQFKAPRYENAAG